MQSVDDIITEHITEFDKESFIHFDRLIDNLSNLCLA